MELQLRNVRCFAKPKAARIAPLTILVGENSTGKSSFLALLRIALEIVHGRGTPNFNTDPFFLGAYDQIAHYRGGRGGRSRSFHLNLYQSIRSQSSTRSRRDASKAKIALEFVQAGSQPALNSYSFSHDPYELNISITEQQKASVQISSPSWTGTLPEDFLPFMPLASKDAGIDLRYMMFMLSETTLFASAALQELGISRQDREAISRVWSSAYQGLDYNPYAIAPVRTKPERTYNPIDDTPRSEGSHVPMLLAKMRFTDKKKWEETQIYLNEFGKMSGLFDEIKLKTLGRSESDPFQIMVKIFGPASNVIDVGYGVSQVLPIIVDLITGERRQIYLLQQPEVHLHPRGQAELGSFFAKFIRRSASWVVVETHSDYLLDRIRLDVKDHKVLKPSDVSVLFFERTGREVQIHNMGIDDDGNLVDVPSGYRNFFLAEEKRFFGI